MAKNIPQKYLFSITLMFCRSLRVYIQWPNFALTETMFVNILRVKEQPRKHQGLGFMAKTLICNQDQWHFRRMTVDLMLADLCVSLNRRGWKSHVVWCGGHNCKAVIQVSTSDFLHLFNQGWITRKETALLFLQRERKESTMTSIQVCHKKEVYPHIWEDRTNIWYLSSKANTETVTPAWSASLHGLKVMRRT